MSDEKMTDLLERVAQSYTPNDSGVLDVVKSVGRRKARVRRFGSAGTALALVVLVAAISARISVGGNSGNATAGPYLNVSSLSRLVSDSSRGTGTSSVNGIVDPFFANDRQGIALKRNCVLSPTTDTLCTLAVVHTMDGGRSWKDSGQPLKVTYPDSRASYPFIDFTTNGKDGWVYGNETFVTHDGGVTLVRDSLGGLVSNVSIAGANVWALSRPCPPAESSCASRLYVASAAGGPWEPMSSAPRLTYPYLILLRPSATRAYLAAQSTQGSLYATTDGGSSWVHHLLPPLCGQLLHLSADTKHTLWALCSSATATDAQAKELYRSGDSGENWMLVAATNTQQSGHGDLPTHGIVTSFTSVGPDDLVIVFDQGPVLVSTDGGKRWIESDLSGAGVLELSFSNSRTGWAVMMSGEIYQTFDGGIRWTPAN